MLLCLCRLGWGNKCSTVRGVGVCLPGSWYGCSAVPRSHATILRLPIALHCPGQPASPSCTTGCPLPVQSAKVTDNQPVMMHICVSVCVGREVLRSMLPLTSNSLFSPLSAHTPLPHTHAETSTHMHKQKHTHACMHMQNHAVSLWGRRELC